MKTRTKVALTALCALLLIVASVAGTLAYLTSEDTVTNTFTIGKVKITMDEAKTDEDGNPVDAEGNAVDLAEAPRVDANTLHLIPGSDYTKDPTIHVEADSEDAYLFVKITDEIAAIQDSDTVLEQLADNGWIAVTGKTNLYYQMHTQDDETVDYVVFETLLVDADADNADLEAVGDQLIIEAYAIQKENVADVTAACTALGL